MNLASIAISIGLYASGGLAGMAEGPSWYPINYDTAVDIASIRKSGNVARIWSMDIFTETNASGVDYILRRYEIDCRDLTMVQVAYSAYNMDGSSKGTGENRSQRVSIPPGTVMSAISDAACDYSYDRDFQTIDSTQEYVEIARSVMRSR